MIRKNSIIDRVKTEDIGIGSFYYFASTSIVGLMSYVGAGRTEEQITLFFFLLVVSIVFVHVAMCFLEKTHKELDVYIEPMIGLMVVAAAICACLSLFPYMTAFFL